MAALVGAAAVLFPVSSASAIGRPSVCSWEPDVCYTLPVTDYCYAVANVTTEEFRKWVTLPDGSLNPYPAPFYHINGYYWGHCDGGDAILCDTSLTPTGAQLSPFKAHGSINGYCEGTEEHMAEGPYGASGRYENDVDGVGVPATAECAFVLGVSTVCDSDFPAAR